MPPTDPSARPAMARRALVAASIGNFVEWYDFAVYGYSALVIAAVFFPDSEGSAGLLATLAVFGVTFLLRPLGGAILGRLGDRVGRRAVLSLTVLGMGIATALMGLLPGYASIGVLAPIGLTLLRLTQGFFAGGEFSGASTYLVEYAPPHRRGLWAALSMATGVLPFGVCGLVILAMSVNMPGQTYEDFGWRLPFLLSLPFALIGLYLRLKIDETPAFREIQAQGTVEQAPLGTVLRDHKVGVLLVFTLASLNGVGSYTVTSYMPTFLQTYAELSQTAALVASSIAVITLAALLPLAGLLGDAIGRRRLILTGTIGVIVLAVPGYLIAGSGSIGTAMVGQLLMIVPLTGIAGALGPTMCELFPTQVRYSGSALGYNFAYAVFGGTAPFVAAFLITSTGSALAPAFYMIGFGLVGLVALRHLPETSGVSLTAWRNPTATGTRPTAAPRPLNTTETTKEKL